MIILYPSRAVKSRLKQLIVALPILRASSIVPRAARKGFSDDCDAKRSDS